MAELKFYHGELARIATNKKNQVRIKKLYFDVAKDIRAKAESLKDNPNVSAQMERVRLQQLKFQTYEAFDDVGKTLEGYMKEGMRDVSAGIVVDVQKFLDTSGLKIKEAFSHIPQEIVAAVSSGKVYEQSWTLSKAIWADSKKSKKDIDEIIAKGIAENKSAYDIAKDLEKYVNPNARKPWDWGKVYPGTKRIIDYNAQRLARTLITHAYQQSLIETAKKNPYVTGVKWIASNSSRVCELCEERDGKIYALKDVPLDHPNGMCTQVIVLDRSPKDIAKDLAEKAKHPLDNPDVEAWKAYIREHSG